MPEVDASDDGIERFVVQHYRSGAKPRSRERVVIAAFDTLAEFEGRLRAEHRRLERRRAAGTADPWERIEGIQMEPGYRRRAADKRQFIKNIAHGVGRPRATSDIPEGIIYFAAPADDADVDDA